MKSLGLVDLDDVEMIMAVEETFNVSFSDKLLQQCNTVGELFQYLKLLHSPSEMLGKCVTSMAFYRVRRAFKSIGVNHAPITPKTPMQALSDMPPRELSRRLTSELNIEASFVNYSIRGMCGAASIYCGVIAFFALWFVSIESFFIFIVFQVVVIALLLGGSFLFFGDPKKYRFATVGDCVKQVAYPVFFTLGKSEIDTREIPLWEAFCGVIAKETGVDPYKIKLGTTFHEPSIGSIKIW